MATSLSDLVAETSTTKAGLLAFQELISVSGNLAIPQVGVVYVYPERAKSPAYMIGISDGNKDRSFYLQGTVNAGTDAVGDVQSIRGTLDEIQSTIATSIRITLEISAIDAAISSKETTDAVRQAAIAERSALVTRRQNLDSRIEQLRTDLRSRTSKPGITVARWTAASQTDGSMEVGRLLGAKSGARRSQSGYLIMAGYRISMVFFGRDFEYYIRAMESEDYEAFKNAAIATYILQSRHVAYTSSLDIESMLQAYADADSRDPISSLRAVDRVRISAYSLELASLSNMGNLQEIEWTRKDLGFSSTKDGEAIVGGTPCPSREVLKTLKLRPQKPFEGPSFEKGWHTVQAVMTTAPMYFKNLREKQCSSES